MRPSAWRSLRRIVGFLVFALFAFAFVGRSPLAEVLARLLPGLQLGPAVLGVSGSFESGSARALIVAALFLAGAILFGRWYCVLLCPLGVLQDLVLCARTAVRRFRRVQTPRLRGPEFRRVPSLPFLRYGLLAAVIAGYAAGSVLLVNLLEPYAFWGRLMRDLAVPAAAFLHHALNAAARLFGTYAELFDVSFDAPVLAFTSMTFLLLVIVTVRRGRLYCSLLCPTGILLGACARLGPRGIRFEADKCVSCGLCERVCPTGCLDSERMRVDRERCILCGDCLAACPRGALRYGGSRRTAENAGSPQAEGTASSLLLRRRTAENAGAPQAIEGRRPQKPAENGLAPRLSRRAFLARCGVFAAGLGGGLVALAASAPAAFLLRRRTVDPSGAADLPPTPPGSLGIRRFASLCVSCHLCVAKCPTGVLSPSFFEYGARGMMQPFMDFRRGFCEYGCTLCGELCPTGAILPVSPERKRTIKIGRVRFAPDRCVVVTRGTVCGACAELCPTQAVDMKPYRDGLDLPFTDDSICTGCGACEYVCPMPRKAIYVRGLAVHDTAEVRAPLHEAPRAFERGEFPF